MECSCKNFLININVDLYILRLIILPRTCSKDRYSVFATHCNCQLSTLNVIHVDGQAVAISEIHRDTPSTIFDLLSEFYKYLDFSQ